MKIKAKKQVPTFKRGDLVQSLYDDNHLHQGVVVEGPYDYNFSKLHSAPAYTVIWKTGPNAGSMKVSEARELSPFIAPPTLVEAIRGLLVHHRILELHGISDTLDDRFSELNAAILRAEVK